MTRDIDRDVIRENEPGHIAYISFFELQGPFHFFFSLTDRLSLYIFYPVSRGRHGCPLFVMTNAVFMTQGAAFVESYECVNLSRRPDPAYQEEEEEMIVSLEFRSNSRSFYVISITYVHCFQVKSFLSFFSLCFLL